MFEKEKKKGGILRKKIKLIEFIPAHKKQRINERWDCILEIE
jgi:hypothetical protein